MRCCRWRRCCGAGYPVRREDIVVLLEQVAAGLKSVDEVAERLAVAPYEDLGFAKVDHHRPLRAGLPEVVFAAGKTAEQTAAILERISASGVAALATRADEAAYAATVVRVPNAQWHGVARCITLWDFCCAAAWECGGVVCRGRAMCRWRRRRR